LESHLEQLKTDYTITADYIKKSVDDIRSDLKEIRRAIEKK
jgi:hypothetical protein